MPGSWTGSDRRDRLPSDWSATRTRVLRRDEHQCQARGPYCAGKATDVDHIRNGDDHDDANLQAICAPCHRAKSAGEGVNARRNLTALRRRPTRCHPGLKEEVRP